MVQVVIVTGASTGIGKSIALHFAADSNYKVWATMRNTAAWDIPPQDNITVASLDVTSDESVDNLVKLVLSIDSHIDILINNAGIGIPGTVESVLIEEAKAVFEVNVWGVVRMLQAVLPSMRRRKSGYIVNISSTAGVRGAAGLDFYASSKFALEGMIECLRFSLAPYNIFVTNVNPGPVKTPIGEKFIEQSGSRVVEDAEGYLGIVLEHVKKIGTFIMERGQPVDEVGQLVLTLVEKKGQAKHVTDIPCNVSTDAFSSDVLSQVRLHPNGWGPLQLTHLQNMPALPKAEGSAL